MSLGQIECEETVADNIVRPRNIVLPSVERRVGSIRLLYNSSVSGCACHTLIGQLVMHYCRDVYVHNALRLSQTRTFLVTYVTRFSAPFYDYDHKLHLLN